MPTAAALLLDQMLPADMQDPNRVWDKKNTEAVLTELAVKHPADYKKTLKSIMDLGLHNVQLEGASIGLSDMLLQPQHELSLNKLRRQAEVIENTPAPAADKAEALRKLLFEGSGKDLVDNTFDTAVGSGNRLALQAASGARGNKSNFQQLTMGDFLVTDSDGKVVPIPVLHGYGEGLSPAEYWASTYGARLGSLATKMGTRDAGFLGKQMAMATHRMVVTQEDDGDRVGVEVRGGDNDNIGAIMAQDGGNKKTGVIKADTVLQREHVANLGDTPIHVRSPLTDRSPHGVSQQSVGWRERGRLPNIGENVGMAASHAITERVSQGSLNTKHGGGMVGGSKVFGGFDTINQMLQAPEAFKDAATLSVKDGIVGNVEKAPQGGHYVTVDGEKHYVDPEQEPTVKVGQRIEAGDLLSTGLPNPAGLVEYKGIGEARRMFVDHFSRVLRDSGVPVNRRNVEIVARSLINHVRVEDVDDNTGAIPGDIVTYDSLTQSYQPRPGAVSARPAKLINHYLERPYAHYTIGTRITPRVADHLARANVEEVTAHPSPPPFSPVMVRLMETGSTDPNPLTRLNSSYMTRSMLHAVHRGETSKTHDTSFVPGLTDLPTFGKDLATKGVY